MGYCGAEFCVFLFLFYFIFLKFIVLLSLMGPYIRIYCTTPCAICLEIEKPTFLLGYYHC